jgi:hypothetical protein
MELGFLPKFVVKARPPVQDLFLFRELRLEFLLERGRVSRPVSRLREAAAARQDAVLRSVDATTPEAIAALLGVPPRKLPSFRWEPELALPDPHAVAAQLPPGPLRVALVKSQAVVVRADGVFATTRPERVEVANAAGETFTWLWGSEPGAVKPAQGGRKPPPPGPFAALLAPQAAAVLLHELFGHPLEADTFFAGRSPWAGRLGTRVVPVPLFVKDDPAAPLPGHFLRDDEGEPARPKVLVASGVLEELLADRSFSAHLPLTPGNARRLSPHHPPAPRISNLLAWVEGGAINPPTEEAQVEILRVRSGVFLPSRGSLLLSVSESYRLHRGLRGERLVPFLLELPVGPGGPAIVAGGGSPVPVAEPGLCIKDGQPLPVGAAASWLLLSGVEVA